MSPPSRRTPSASRRPRPRTRRGSGAPAEAGTRFRELLEGASDLVYRMRVLPAFRFEYLGGAVEAITGRTRDELYRNPALVLQSIHPDDAPFVRELASDAAEGKRLVRSTVVLRWLHPDGRVVWAEHRRVPIVNRSGALVAVEGIARDVTERIEAQRRLRRSEQQLRRLAARVQSAREQERTVIARELHDELGQTLTAIKLELERAVGLFRREELEPPAVDRLQALVGLVELGIAAVKRIATNLRPPALDHLGLAEAIRWEALAFQARTGLRCRVEATTDGHRLSTEQQTVLFRIFQEALTNIARHARASAVDVALTERGAILELQVRDNGRGISVRDVRDPRAIGLLGMRERAALIGGACQVAGQRGRGTRVTVRVKLASARRPPRLNERARRTPKRQAS